jgi:hypothetical protein
MRSLLLFIALSFTLIAEASPKKRQPANRFPTRAYTIACRGEEADNLIALVRVTLDTKDRTTGLASATAYIREAKGYRVAELHGRFTKVANEELVLTLRQGFGAPFEFLLDPAKESTVPGFAEKQSCEVTGKMESL